MLEDIYKQHLKPAYNNTRVRKLPDCGQDFHLDFTDKLFKCKYPTVISTSIDAVGLWSWCNWFKIAGIHQ